MTKIVSITMVIIIMLNAGLATPSINNSPLTTITASAKVQIINEGADCSAPVN